MHPFGLPMFALKLENVCIKNKVNKWKKDIVTDGMQIHSLTQ